MENFIFCAATGTFLLLPTNFFSPFHHFVTRCGTVQNKNCKQKTYFIDTNSEKYIVEYWTFNHAALLLKKDQIKLFFRLSYSSAHYQQEFQPIQLLTRKQLRI